MHTTPKAYGAPKAHRAPRAIVSPMLAVALVLALGGCGSSEMAQADTAATEAAVAEAHETVSDTEAPAVTYDRGDQAGEPTRVYFAAPLFCESEKDYNLELTKVLEEAGYTVFLPQRDGYLASELEGKSEEELVQMIFEKDLDEVLRADVLVFNLDGRVPDEGACVELGIAYANGKRCYGLRTDVRAVESGLALNPMISGCLTHLFNNSDGDALVEDLRAYLAENEL